MRDWLYGRYYEKAVCKNKSVISCDYYSVLQSKLLLTVQWMLSEAENILLKDKSR